MPWLILELSVLHGLMLEIDELSSFALRIPEIHQNPHYSAVDGPLKRRLVNA